MCKEVANTLVYMTINRKSWESIGNFMLYVWVHTITQFFWKEKDNSGTKASIPSFLSSVATLPLNSMSSEVLIWKWQKKSKKTSQNLLIRTDKKWPICKPPTSHYGNETIHLHPALGIMHVCTCTDVPWEEGKCFPREVRYLRNPAGI